MESHANGTYIILRTLLWLGKIESNALEAKFARDQAISAARQRQTILDLKVKTIISSPRH
ncbi:hypothetical protein HD806DRAFT_513913 [Xylariaceae sp. AK1471]|nr:hypothetical protein HD806DRAFT_513913 [Xylariaceae sp. AK1471]